MDREVWERQAGESSRAWEAFAIYRDQGAQRSHAKVGQALGKTRQALEGWSRRWGWVARCAAWDAHIDAERRVEAAEELHRMRQRHAQVAGAFFTRVVQRLQRIDAAELSPADLARWTAVAADLERRARDLPERLEVTGRDGGALQVRAEVADWTPEQRTARLDQLVAEAARRRGLQLVSAPTPAATPAVEAEEVDDDDADDLDAEWDDDPAAGDWSPAS